MQRVLDCLTFGKTDRSYNEDVRSFCLTLHFYSPRAYNYVRSKFNDNLPGISTIRKWYSSLNASPGFTVESFEALKKKVTENSEDGEKKKLICALMCDEMAIRRHVQFNPSRSKFDGFIDIGRTNANDENVPVAKDALVFMVSEYFDGNSSPFYIISNEIMIP